MQKRRSVKHSKLLASAQALIHQQGLHKTTLADISADSGVSLGNMYYYFKTKDEILTAVATSQVEQFYELVNAFDSMANPRTRLAAFIDARVKIAPQVAKWGCPIGSLMQEVSKADVQLDDSKNALKARLEWAERQFTEWNAQDPKALAQHYIGGLQGACLLSSTCNDPAIFVEQGERIKAWLDTI